MREKEKYIRSLTALLILMHASEGKEKKKRERERTVKRERERKRSTAQVNTFVNIHFLHLGLLNLICEVFRGENQVGYPFLQYSLVLFLISANLLTHVMHSWSWGCWNLGLKDQKRVSDLSRRVEVEIMLRKRSRSLQKDQYKDHLMPDSGSESCFQSYVLGQKHKSNSFFSTPGLFVGLSTKGLSDSDSAKSPTSPLDFRGFSNLGSPLRSPRSCHDGGSLKIWNCNKVGLGIVDSLDDETKPSGTDLRSSESRNILFGSHMRINIPNSPSHLCRSIDSFVPPNSLPKKHVISSDTQIQSPHLQPGCSDVVFGTGETPLEPESLGEIRSFLSESSKFESPLVYCNPISSSENFWLENQTPQMGSPPSIGGGQILDNSLGMKPSSLPMSTGSGHGFMGSLSASEIELSEDYTCVIYHGPDRKTTHIYGDCILECHKNELDNCSKKEEQQTMSPWVLKSSDSSTPYRPYDFLSYCYSCKKKLEEGKDIYMYRGEKAFCSCSCRSQEILLEEEMEKTINNSSENSPKSTYHE